ncbi:kinase-like domain-containing protein [Rhizophagus clarus]|uniref:Kinase-like domain-containing protein n=1 Tax=Rhizophagus clarus TaxID=94130 RepID=A0A8H3LIH3_9GLOM|nr:kinase-like domain-containing protein [Rhizophagus clarus]
MMQNFNNLNIEEIIYNLSSSKNNFNVPVEEIYNIIFKLANEGKEWNVTEHVLEYFNNHNINSQEIYYWILNNQNDSNYNFLLGCFNYYEIGINKNCKEAFSLFINASKKTHILAGYYIGLCYEFGNEVLKNEKLAFKYYEKAAKNECAAGEFKIGYCCYKELGHKKSPKMAIFWYKKAASNGHLIAAYNLAYMYKNGKGMRRDYDKAFGLFKISAEVEHMDGMTMLGYCYSKGIGINVDKRMAFKSYQKVTKLENLGNYIAQYNLVFMYNYEIGIEKDLDKAIY